LGESDLEQRRGSLLVRRGKGGRRRKVGMDEWAWEQLQPWLTARLDLRVGPLLCIAIGSTRGRAWSPGAARTEHARPPPARACGDGSRRISSVTATRSRWPAKVFH
jgi:hypothetical protein